MGFFFRLKIRWIRIGILNKPLTFITAIQINNAHFVNQNPTVTLLDFMQKPLIKMMSKHFCHSLEDVVQIYEIGLRFFSQFNIFPLSQTTQCSCAEKRHKTHNQYIFTRYLKLTACEADQVSEIMWNHSPKSFLIIFHMLWGRGREEEHCHKIKSCWYFFL